MKQLFFVLLLSLFFVLPLNAQEDDCNNGHYWGWDNKDNDDNNAPIDGGLSILIAADAGLGIKKLRTKNLKN